MITIQDILDRRRKLLRRTNVLCIDCPTNEYMKQIMQEAVAGEGNAWCYSYNTDESWVTEKDGREYDRLSDELENTICIWNRTVKEILVKRYTEQTVGQVNILDYQLNWAVAPWADRILEGTKYRVKSCIVQLFIGHKEYKQAKDMCVYSVNVVYEKGTFDADGEPILNAMGTYIIGTERVEKALNSGNKVYKKLLNHLKNSEITYKKPRVNQSNDVITYCNE